MRAITPEFMSIAEFKRQVYQHMVNNFVNQEIFDERWELELTFEQRD